MLLIWRLFLSLCFLVSSAVLYADTKAPYSKPFHKQGRGWYPSIYWSTGRNLGSFYFPNTNGRKFEALESYEWNSEENGLIYVYRPNSQWAMEELEAPSYYVNDELVFNLRSGSFTVLELPAGSYDFAARKSFIPLIGFEAFDDKLMMAFDLNLLIDIGLEVDAGSVHYFRHSEVTLPKRLHSSLEPDDEMATGDVQLVDEELALEEIIHTRYLNHSFWHSNDSERIEALLSGEMQDYGWFSVIWPWSNNFLFGFPLFYLPSDIYLKLRGEKNITLEQELYVLADDREAYLEAIRQRREPKRNWLAPWRAPRSHLSLNDELMLEKLEKAALAGNIAPAPIEHEQDGSTAADDDDSPWYWPFRTVNDPEVVPFSLSQNAPAERRAAAERIKLTLD
jgi:Protein of unknown function (DUF2846)